MKEFRILFALATMLILLIFSSCKEDEPVAIGPAKQNKVIA